MSFSKTYSFKNLRDIHFVDRDETIVRAIHEIFLQTEPPATIIGKSENPEKKNVKVTENQPPGSISIRKSLIKLEGFNDCSGSIILTYVFCDGRQGVC